MDVSKEFINAIDLLRTTQITNNLQKTENSANPISELITPEWHYSESIKIFESKSMSWDTLGKSDVVQSIADEINKLELNRDKILNMEFEKNFISWYQAYHYLPREKWGIHIRYDSWLNISDYFNKNCSSIVGRILDCVKSAFLYLFIHELFHHIVENAASMLEIISGKSNLYTKYYSDIYSQVFNSAKCMEEILSNSYLFVWADKCHIDRDFLKQELLKQGVGYREFIQFLDTKFLNGNRILVSQILYSQLDPLLHNPLEQTIDITDPFEYLTIHNVPVWLHRKAKFVHNKM